MDTALESSVYVSSPEFAGWLMKRGFHWRKLWKRRWVALHGAEIVYMDKEPSLEDAANMTVTKSQITTSTVIDREDIDGNPDGFAIHINDGQSPTWYLRAESAREKKSWLMRLSHVHAIVRWLENYEKVRVLGVGGSGIVYELLHKSNGRRFAMKEMEIKNKTQMQMAISEAEMLKDIMENVSHPNVMHIEKVFQVGSKFYMVFPLCTGGELYDHIIRRGHFTELDAALLIRDLVGAIHALHEHNILHLDIKPENILFESMDESAKIKITDFGLSRVYTKELEEAQKNKFSMELMMSKLRAFSESGELNRERLRGTIGYMSPELILLGYCSKTTDVFAAGVVLYILLCGKPPFNSKSNREVLEKTAKGVYNMSGPEWEEISEDAKDLVRRMLVTNPHERISTPDILAHPWLSNLDEDIADTNQPGATTTEDTAGSLIANGVDLRNASSGVSKRTTGRRGVGANLTGALKMLSGHVHNLRSEKMATNMTRLVSLMQGEGAGHSILASRYLVPIAPDGATDAPGAGKSEAESAEKMMLELMSMQFRSLFVSALSKLELIKNGKIRNEHFMAIAKHFNPRLHAGTTSSSGNTGIFTLLLLTRYFDRDSDGFISMDDIFTAQAHMIQRNEVFLRVMFRVYTESLWYPGRHLNLMNLRQQVPCGNLLAAGEDEGGPDAPPPAPVTPSSGLKHRNSSRVIDNGESSGADVVEPPRFITGRHVAAVFERLGFDPTKGQKAFQLLCDALARLKGNSAEDDGQEYRDSFAIDSNMIPEGVASSRRSSVDANETSSNVPNAALAAAFGDMDIRPSRDGGRASSFSANADSGSRKYPSATAGGNAVPAAATSNSGANAASNPPVSGSSGGKMDINDFIKAIALDDILIQALFKNSRLIFSRLRKRIDERTKEGNGKQDFATEVLVEEIQTALDEFKSIESSPASGNHPIASALGRAAYGIVKGAKGLSNRPASAATPTISASSLAADLADSDDEV